MYNKSVFSFLHMMTTCHCLHSPTACQWCHYAVPQLIDISCRSGLQQQTCSSEYAAGTLTHKLTYGWTSNRRINLARHTMRAVPITVAESKWHHRRGDCTDNNDARFISRRGSISNNAPRFCVSPFFTQWW